MRRHPAALLVLGAMTALATAGACSPSTGAGPRASAPFLATPVADLAVRLPSVGEGHRAGPRENGRAVMGADPLAPRLASGPDTDRDAVARLEGDPRPAPARTAGARLSLDDRMVLTAARGVYHETLLHHPGARAYLAARGIPEQVVRRCRLGYADGAALRPSLERHRLGVRRATELGLLWPRGGETLAGRIVVPELRGGQCVWMLGRALDEGQEPKYVGLSLPKPILGHDRVQGRRWVMVVEGAFDYLTGVGWGLPVCALLGTHVRAERLAVLERAERVALVFDQDAPGQQAAAALAARLGPRATSVSLPDGVKDLSELGVRPAGRAWLTARLGALGFAVDDADDRRLAWSSSPSPNT